MGLLLLSSCDLANSILPVANVSTACTTLKLPLNTHLNSVVGQGDAILSIDGDEVLVTAAELSAAFDGLCK